MQQIHKSELLKPDGRKLILYGTEPIANIAEVPMPKGIPASPNPHLRWHPLRGEWVDYAGHRQARTFLPPPEFDPLAPTHDPQNPTELPQGNYQVAVFDNSFPSLTLKAGQTPETIVETRPAKGITEVVVYTQRSRGSLGELSLPEIELIIQVWGDRYTELGKLEEILYVMPFENRGVEVGVTLHHPHGQIYAYPFVPPIPALELQQQGNYFYAWGRTILEALVEVELRDSRRILFDSKTILAFVPAFARYPYEVWIAPKEATPSLAALSELQISELARALKTVLLKYDGLWKRPFPYIMVVHQAPTDGLPHPESHLHFEFYPALRAENRIKYLAGTEVGAGMFTNDTIPEEKAAELQAVQVDV